MEKNYYFGGMYEKIVKIYGGLCHIDFYVM